MISSGRKTGVYEYLRKANKHIEKGDYLKSISVLEKAHKIVPSNDDIWRTLVYATVKQSQKLRDEGNIDKAISLLTALQTEEKDNPDIDEMLSFLYASKAVELMKSKKYSSSSDLCQKSVTLAVKHSRSSQNISNYFFNEGYFAFNKNDFEMSVMCLKASYSIWYRYDSLYFLGMVYYKESNFETAVFYWEKAKPMAPKDSDVSDKIEQAKREIQLKQKMNVINTEHFQIEIYKDCGFEPSVLKDVLSKVFIAVGNDLKFYPPDNTVVVFYTENDFRTIFKQSNMVQGFYDGKIRIPLKQNINVDELTLLLAHEYTHAVVSFLTDKKTPVWVTEGLAMHEQSRFFKYNLKYMPKYFEKEKSLNLQDVENGFKRFDNPFLMALSYEGAYTAVLLILDRWGWNGMLGLLKRIKNGRHYVNAIDEEFFASIELFEKMWNDFTRKMC